MDVRGRQVGTGLARRLIPCLDVAGGRVVKGVRFQDLRDAGDPVQQAARYDADGADELVLLDISASPEERGTLLDLVARVAETLFVPFTVGGGIRSVDEATAVLRAGADKVAVNTALVRDPELGSRLADRFGRQCVVAAVDAKARAVKGGHGRSAPKWEVMVNGGREPTGLDVVEWAERAEQLGAGEILLTSMDTDGTQDGYDLPLTAAVARAVRIPVIASGGAGRLEHLADALDAGAHGVLAATLFHYRGTTIPEARAFLASRGYPVRP
jgi:imidazole glycerol-phosphate synthase subunit HisF